VKRCGQSRKRGFRRKGCLDLLVGCQARQVYWRRGIGANGTAPATRPRHNASLKPSQGPLPHLVLDMRSLLETSGRGRCGTHSCRRTAQAADLRIEETRRGIPRTGKGGEAAEVGWLMRSGTPLILECARRWEEIGVFSKSLKS